MKKDKFLSGNFTMLEYYNLLQEEASNKKFSKKDIFFFPSDKDNKVKLKKLLSNLCDSYLFTDNNNNNDSKKNDKNQKYAIEDNSSYNCFTPCLLAPENKISLSIKKSSQLSKGREATNSIANSKVLREFNDKEKESDSNNKLLNLMIKNTTKANSDKNSSLQIFKNKHNHINYYMRDKIKECKLSLDNNGFESNR